MEETKRKKKIYPEAKQYIHVICQNFVFQDSFTKTEYMEEERANALFNVLIW